MTAVLVPALVAAITDVLPHMEECHVYCSPAEQCNHQCLTACLRHRTAIAERVAAAVVGLLPGLPPEDVAALFASRGAFITGGDSVYVPGLDRLPAPAGPERGE